MKSRDYWRRRFEQLEEAQLKKGLAYYDDLEREYKRAAAAIEQQISAWYSRFAANNQVSFAEAKQLLNSKELAELRWSVEEYIKYGKENAVNGQWLKQLENASARVHISRLEALQLQIQQQVEVLYGNQLDGLDRTMRGIYAEGYYRTAYEIQRGINIGWDLQRINDKQIAAVLAKPWAADGKTFSERIWGNKDQLVSTLHTELTQVIIRGDPPDTMIRTLAKKMNTAQNNAGRLVMTEAAFFASAAQRDCFSELDVERYEIVATLDSHTSAICQSLDGKVFEMKDYRPGVTAPPFHCWCRTVTVPFFEGNAGSRAARNAKGKTYYVPDSMKYPEWKKTFVAGGAKDGLQAVGKSATLKVEFTPAKTVKEAGQYAIETLGIPHADYTGLHIEVANAWNAGLADNFNRFPELNEQFGFVGESHARNAALKPVLRQHYLDDYKRLNPHVPEKILEVHADDAVNDAMYRLRVPSNAYASSWAPRKEPFRQFAGITFNSVQGKDLGKLLNSLKADVANKFHPVGCDTVKSILDHEIGHQLDTMLNLSGNDAIRKLFDARTREQITEELSRYAWDNKNPNQYSEFIAEAWAEYSNNPQPRTMAKAIGEEIERRYADWKKQNS
ncbi:MAG TPA: minor capsid protein [Selenomonadales bacterium]|nr:minor capsid protein [Selenomonadales bacterium]